MHAIIFELDTTVFAADTTLHDDVASLLAIVRRLGLKVGALTSGDHRMVVRLEEAGVRHHFDSIISASHVAEPKQSEAVHQLLGRLDVAPEQTAIVSHLAGDMTLGKDAGLAKTIRVMHGPVRAEHHTADTDRVVEDIATVLDVLE